MYPFFIVAHRGGKSPYKENTLEALQHGLKHCGNAVEMDVRFDHLRKRFYLEHDFLHSPMDNMNVIDKIIPYLPGHATLFIELKTLYSLRKKYALHFLKVVEQMELAHRAIIMSFNPFVLIHLKGLASHLQIGFLLSNRFWGWMFRAWVYKVLKPQYLMLNKHIFHKKIFLDKMLTFARIHKLKVLIFTANELEYWQKVKEYQLDGVITDYPREACSVIREITH